MVTIRENFDTVDVREHLGARREPFGPSMEAVGRRHDGGQIRVIAAFEPRPVNGALAVQGFASAVSQGANGIREVIFTFLVPAAGDEVLFP